jgi:hypothetical protein
MAALISSNRSRASAPVQTKNGAGKSISVSKRSVGDFLQMTAKTKFSVRENHGKSITHGGTAFAVLSL